MWWNNNERACVTLQSSTFSLSLRDLCKNMQSEKWFDSLKALKTTSEYSTKSLGDLDWEKIWWDLLTSFKSWMVPL